MGAAVPHPVRDQVLDGVAVLPPVEGAAPLVAAVERQFADPEDAGVPAAVDAHVGHATLRPATWFSSEAFANLPHTAMSTLGRTLAPPVDRTTPRCPAMITVMPSDRQVPTIHPSSCWA